MWRRAHGATLVVVLVAAAGLRCARLDWGLRDGVFAPGEGEWIVRAQRFATVTTASFGEPSLVVPSFYGYVTGLAAHAAAAAGLGAPIVPAGVPGAEHVLLVARAVSAAASTCTVLVVGLLGASMWDSAWVGLVAAALVATAPLDALGVHDASVDALAGLCATLALAASWRIVRRGESWAALGAGAATGFAVATSYTGGVVATAVAWAVLERGMAERSPRTALRLTLSALAGAAQAMLLGCPVCVLRRDLLAQAIAYRRLVDAAGADRGGLTDTIGWWGRRWAYELVAALPHGLGLPLALLALAGVALALRRRRPAERLLLAAVLPCFAVVGASALRLPGSVLPLVPPLGLLAASALAAVPRRPVRLALGGATIAWGVALTASQVARLSWEQQDAVGAWLAARAGDLPPQARVVAIPDADDDFRLTRPISRAGFRPLPAQPGRWFREPVPFFVLPEWYAIAIRRERRDPRLVADLERLESGAAGYRPAFRLPIPRHLQYALDVRLDPAFATDPRQGAIGFTVYAREGSTTGSGASRR